MKLPKDPSSVGIIILAAGLGRRMRSPLPKVLHELSGRPLLFHTLELIKRASSKAHLAVVVGHGRELVEEMIRRESSLKDLDITLIHQPEQLGTGHAARCAMDSSWGKARLEEGTPILILPGDLPLLRAEQILGMIQPLGKSEEMRLMTCNFVDPSGYGRIVRKSKGGPILRIVEEKDANVKEKSIKEVSTSIYLFRPDFLSTSLHRLSNKNAQNEYYLTDLVAEATRLKKTMGVLVWNDASDLKGVNDPWELAQVSRILNERLIRQWALEGVKFLDPWSTLVEASVQFDEGVVVYPGAVLQGTTRIGKNSVIGPGVLLKNVEVGDSSHLKSGTMAENTRIKPGSTVGPYTQLPLSLSVRAIKVRKNATKPQNVSSRIQK